MSGKSTNMSDCEVNVEYRCRYNRGSVKLEAGNSLKGYQQYAKTDLEKRSCCESQHSELARKRTGLSVNHRVRYNRCFWWIKPRDAGCMYRSTFPVSNGYHRTNNTSIPMLIVTVILCGILVVPPTLGAAVGLGGHHKRHERRHGLSPRQASKRGIDPMVSDLDYCQSHALLLDTYYYKSFH